jgi:hypothetical protein
MTSALAASGGCVMLFQARAVLLPALPLAVIGILHRYFPEAPQYYYVLLLIPSLAVMLYCSMLPIRYFHESLYHVPTFGSGEGGSRRMIESRPSIFGML